MTPSLSPPHNHHHHLHTGPPLSTLLCPSVLPVLAACMDNAITEAQPAGTQEEIGEPQRTAHFSVWPGVERAGEHALHSVPRSYRHEGGSGLDHLEERLMYGGQAWFSKESAHPQGCTCIIWLSSGSTMEIDIILRSSILDKLSPGRPVCGCGLPVLKAYMALLEDLAEPTPSAVTCARHWQNDI
ncbi:unnamed protein product [Boreogadus saida]